MVDDIPLKPENYRILHPEIIHKTGQVLQTYTLKQGTVGFFYIFISLLTGYDRPKNLYASTQRCMQPVKGSVTSNAHALPNLDENILTLL